MKAMKFLLILFFSCATTLAEIQQVPTEDSPSKEDQCEGLCEVNAECVTTGQGPSCSCLPGYSGDPYVECTQEGLSLPLDVSKKSIKKFIRIDEKVTFPEALLHCLNNNMQLATIETKEENDQVKSLMTDDTYSYTSGYLLRMPWVFHWLSSGQEVTYSDWGAGLPSAPKDYHYYCLVVSRRGWNNYRCGYKRSFICQYYE